MNLMYRKSLTVVFGLLLAATTPLFAQHPVKLERPELERPVEKVDEFPAEALGKSASKVHDERIIVAPNLEQFRNAHIEFPASLQKEFEEAEAKAKAEPKKEANERARAEEKAKNEQREEQSWFSSAELKLNHLVDDAIAKLEVFKEAGNQQIMKKLRSENQDLPPPATVYMGFKDYVHQAIVSCTVSGTI